MAFSDFFIRGRQFFGFLLPGSVWVFSALILMHWPRKPIELITKNEPNWVQFGTFLAVSYIAGFVLHLLSLRFTMWLSGKALGFFSARDNNSKIASSRAFGIGVTVLFLDKAMEVRVENLRTRVFDCIDAKYAREPGFDRPSSELLFSFCKRLIREKTSVLGKDLETYEEEINLLGALPLPLILFAVVWLISWVRAAERSDEWIQIVMPGLAAAFVIAVFCIGRIRPLVAAETKEVYESFLTAHLGDTGKKESR